MAAGLTGSRPDDPRRPEVIDDVAMVGIRIDAQGRERITLVVLSPNPNAPFATWRELDEDQAHRIQVAIGRKLKALRD